MWLLPRTIWVHMYSDLNAYEKAEQAYLAALSIRERLAKTNAEKYEPDVATTQNNLGILFFSQGKLDLAFEYLDKSLPVYRKLALQSPQKFELQDCSYAHDSILRLDNERQSNQCK